jgi:hypothetical protein
MLVLLPIKPVEFFPLIKKVFIRVYILFEYVCLAFVAEKNHTNTDSCTNFVGTPTQ